MNWITLKASRKNCQEVRINLDNITTYERLDSIIIIDNRAFEMPCEDTAKEKLFEIDKKINPGLKKPGKIAKLFGVK